MTKALEYIGIVKDGKLPTGLMIGFITVIRRMEGQMVRLTLAPYKRKRSNRQNSYYWGVVIPLVHAMFTDAGNIVDEEEVHAYLKEHVGGLTTMVTTPSGERSKIVRSTTSLTTTEFEEYMEKVRAWAALFGTQIPLPGENEIPIA